MLLTFKEYKNMGGTLEENDFKRFSLRAFSRIQEVGFGRITEKVEQENKEVLQILIMDVLEMLEGADSGSGLVVSESNNGISKTYECLSAEDYSKSVTDTIHEVLRQIKGENGQSLTYLGVN